MVQMTFHILYDSTPVLHIMLRHKKTLEKEEKQTTSFVMDARETSICGPTEDDNWRVTLKNLEKCRPTSSNITQLRFSFERDRTMVHEDHENRQLLMSRDSETGSVNDSSR